MVEVAFGVTMGGIWNGIAVVGVTVRIEPVNASLVLAQFILDE